jgi:O-acetyl-ADP-ribose deacetylase (regulator of RNase III)
MPAVITVHVGDITTDRYADAIVNAASVKDHE